MSLLITVVKIKRVEARDVEKGELRSWRFFKKILG
jgi:hypothetical protein